MPDLNEGPEYVFRNEIRDSKPVDRTKELMDVGWVAAEKDGGLFRRIGQVENGKRSSLGVMLSMTCSEHPLAASRSAVPRHEAMCQ